VALADKKPRKELGMNRRIRTIAVALAAVLALMLPASAGAFPYLTIAAAKRAIGHYEHSWYEREAQEGSWTVSDCEHETLDLVLVWCRVKGIMWPEGEPSRWERWEEWDWAELLPSDRIEAGTEE
jgi:hypothetical protein